MSSSPARRAFPARLKLPCFRFASYRRKAIRRFRPCSAPLAEMSKKTVISVDVNSQKCKQKALQSVAGLQGIDQLLIDMREKTLTVIGDADPVLLTLTVRKQFRCAQLISVGPAKEEKKDAKKEEKKEPEKKDDKKGETKSDGKNEEKKPPEPPMRICPCAAPEIWYRVNENWHMANDENPNACSIC